ncbi:pyridoxamine 5'-phosphate oxidase family protein [Pseudochryseolinea flava]|uniref:Pyridoxamine 5'-phosphate oxidase family protein n=1 Tax=Pseudochryseolinea flava TaxID=2059302 RepID=A0A364Y8B3_9BACT|nr:pyridoxamine 5'-phosphate oxidase family protein [Pseudochryseolinea flava]RAW02374.1 pyridoxamine 5'-phosphate oxidase family protein [Pseudochryseolinea flava]
MLGQLTENQCRHILTSNHIGRLGFHDAQRITIIPIAYATDAKHIYSHAIEGNKTAAMRKNASVCFQVDNIDSLTNWRSVIVWGRFEEITSPAEQEKIRSLFDDQLAPLTLGETVSPDRVVDTRPQHVIKKKQPVIYKIVIEDISGKFEKS